MAEKESPLERAILGVVDRIGPVTPYGVRVVFEASPSSHWSGSSGAVYPAIRRLAKRGLLKGRARSDDARGSTEYILTADGRMALRSWLASEIDADEAAQVFDPIRLRILFMEALPKAGRRRLVRVALDRLRELREVETEFGRRMTDDGAWGAVQANRGAVLVLEARIRWLEEVEASLD